VAKSYNARALEMDLDLCRLAMYTDPRYKEAACYQEQPALQEPTRRQQPNPFQRLAIAATSILQKRGFSAEECTRVVEELRKYHAGIAPYNLTTSGPDFSVRSWWQAVEVKGSNSELVALALLLLKIVPHAAATERTFSNLGWSESGRRTRLNVGTLRMLATISATFKNERGMYVFIGTGIGGVP
jgi:hypothetical protein